MATAMAGAKGRMAADGTITTEADGAAPLGGRKATVNAAEQPAREARTRKPFPVVDVGSWPEDLSLRREDMYGDDGR